jgi:putative redox protein
LTDEQRGRLIEIANKCPIHRLMEGQIHVETLLSEAGSSHP